MILVLAKVVQVFNVPLGHSTSNPLKYQFLMVVKFVTEQVRDGDPSRLLGTR